MRRLLAVAILAAGCTRAAAPPATAPSRLRVVMAPELSTIDPHRQRAHGGLSVVSNVYEGLTAFDAEMRVVPALAERWESPDELTWRFHLRRGVLFHDGRPLRAADVVASLQRARLPGSSAAGGLEAVKAVTAPAADVVEIRTARPSLMLLNDLATAFVLPADAPPAPLTAPIGTGPYRVVRFAADRGVDLVAWERHWAGTPKVAAVEIVFDPSPDTRLKMVATGLADVALRVPEAAPAPAAQAGYRILSHPAPGARVIGLRVDRAPFSDRRLREAVSLALDREGLTQQLMAGRARPVGQVLPPGILGHDPALLPRARDLAAARARVAQATGGRGLAVTMEHGPGRAAEAQAIAAQLGEAGLRIQLRQRDVAALLSSLELPDVSMALFSYVFSGGDTVDFFESILHTRQPARGYGAENRFGFGDPRVDALVEKAGTYVASQTRLPLYQQAQGLAMEEVPLVPLWEVPWVFAIRDDVEWTPGTNGWFDAAHAWRRPPEH